MLKFVPIILICLTNVPDVECKSENKNVSVTIGEPQNSPMSCLMAGQTQVAGLANAPKQGEPYYVRIKCVPKVIEN